MAFPALIFIGLSPITANATATLAVFPGTIATMLTYRRELWMHKDKLPTYIIISLIGGTIGALLLLNISNATFSGIVPYLLLGATLLFTFRTRFIAVVRRISRHKEGARPGLIFRAITMAAFTLIAIYGGFFGAGMGILLLALFSLMGMQSLHEMNALRACCGLCANVIAIALFGASGIIIWQDAMVMAVGGVLGGYFGAYYALRLPQVWSRWAVVLIGWGMTIYFFRDQIR